MVSIRRRTGGWASGLGRAIIFITYSSGEDLWRSSVRSLANELEL